MAILAAQTTLFRGFLNSSHLLYARKPPGTWSSCTTKLCRPTRASTIVEARECPLPRVENMSQFLEKAAKYEGGFLGFLHRQVREHPTSVPHGTTLKGCQAILTGGNSGLGFEACRQLLQLGLSKLLITARSQAKGDEAIRKLRNEFPAAASIEAWLLDMSSYESITSFATRCRALPAINIVILNAGLILSSLELNKTTGHEQTFQVNYLSTALLTFLLLPILKQRKPPGPSTKPPIFSIITSDTSHLVKKLDASSAIIPQCDRHEQLRTEQYFRSKLLQIWFVQKLAQVVPSSVVTINACCPGLVSSTALYDHLYDGLNPVLKALLSRAQHSVARTIEDGATNYIYATAVMGEDSHGSYVSDWTIKP
jgi:NAD(P)-dependent dehydrogenase (short-subunit alcohol dehydrogenase family)